MGYLDHLLTSKGWTHIPRRLCMIANRFGLGSLTSRRALEQFLEITGAHGCRPTLCITADLLDHHGPIIEDICGRDVDIGLHGRYHIDHSLLSSEAQVREIAAGIANFKNIGIQVSGFRAPFLRFNEATGRAVVANNLLWASNSVMYCEGAGCSELLKKSTSVQALREFYTYRSFAKEPSLPRWEWGTGCLKIPILVPDDEMLVDRLRIREPTKITDIWLRMLNVSHQQGELFTLLIHPERMDWVAKAMDTLLKTARDLGDVWVASLDEISRWWHERARASVEVSDSHHGTFRVAVRGPRALTVYIQNPVGAAELVTLAKDGSFTLRSGFRPVIGIPADCDDGVRASLRNEGFLLEPENGRSQCSFTLNDHTSAHHRLLLESLTQAHGPLVRLWRWPNRFRSALAITADLDAITLWDFVRRARHFHRFEVRQPNRGPAGNSLTS
jgi:peptidoglycan/xylan/chitin deacetylase (PgdA/CDA1 family)